MRSPTAADTRRFLHLAKKHGVPTEVILPWLPERGKPGRRAHDDQLTSIELFVRVAMRDRNMSRHRALHWLYDNIFKGLGRLDHNDRSSAIIARFGRDADAAVARVSKKLRKGGFEKRPMESLVPREWLELGVDPSRFTTS
jgi:hypothetical protein